MSELLKIAVVKYCDEICRHDMFNYGMTCQAIIREIDYYATSEITPTRIAATLKDGRYITLLRLPTGWKIDVSKDQNYQIRLL